MEEEEAHRSNSFREFIARVYVLRRIRFLLPKYLFSRNVICRHGFWKLSKSMTSWRQQMNLNLKYGSEKSVNRKISQSDVAVFVIETKKVMYYFRLRWKLKELRTWIMKEFLQFEVFSQNMYTFFVANHVYSNIQLLDFTIDQFFALLIQTYVYLHIPFYFIFSNLRALNCLIV